ncbi:MAG: MFS transporter [Gammaproteobacteria bacterium]|nr:MFS transporter [Gammaproteobacteria bacterium]
MAHAFHHNASEINTPDAPKKATCRSWIVVLVASLFFFYEFIQMNVFNSISSSLMHSFHIDAARLGDLSSFYFIANVVFLFIAGMLLDRCSTRRVILTALAVCILGTALFSFSTSFAWACFFRFLTGIGSAFCFLSVIRLASRWFPANRMALITGLVVTMAMLGGWVSQTPMALLAHAVDWRVALKIDAAAGVFFFLLIFAVVKDYPAEHAEAHHAEQTLIQEIGFFTSLRMAFFRLQNWFGGLYVCLMNLPVGLLGGLWGVLYLTHTYSISKIQASEISSMLFIGTLVGAPIVGWISDKIQMRRPPMLVGAVISLGLMLSIIYVPNLSYWVLFTLFFLMGICTSTQIIGYPLVAENSKRVITAMSVSVVNISVQGGSALFQPFFGYLLDKHMMMRADQISTHFLSSDFKWAMMIFPVGFILAILIVFVLPETRCRQIQK